MSKHLQTGVKTFEMACVLRFGIANSLFNWAWCPSENFTDQPSLSDPCPNHHHNVLVRPSWHMKGLSYYDRGYSQQCTLLSYRATTCTLQWGRWYRDIYTNAPKQKDPIKNTATTLLLWLRRTIWVPYGTLLQYAISTASMPIFTLTTYLLRNAKILQPWCPYPHISPDCCFTYPLR